MFKKAESTLPDMDAGEGKHEPKAAKAGKGGVPRGEHHQANHKAPTTHAEFHKLGNPGESDEY